MCVFRQDIEFDDYDMNYDNILLNLIDEEPLGQYNVDDDYQAQLINDYLNE